MDPSIMHLLEGDEDETMHTSADVVAFAAALNRDINSDTSTSQPLDSDISVLSQGSGYTSNQFLPQWNPSTHMENAGSTIQQIQTERLSSESGLQQQEAVIHSQKALDDVSVELHPFPPEKQTVQGDSCQIQSRQNAPHLSQLAAMHDSGNVPVHNPGSNRTNSADHKAQLMKLQNMNSQTAVMSRIVKQQILTTAGGTSNKQPILPGASSQQALISGNINQLARGPSLYEKQLPFAVLLPIILPQLDKDKVMQLMAIYNKLRRNEISRNDFVRHMRSYVGDQTLKVALHKLQSQRQTAVCLSEMEEPNSRETPAAPLVAVNNAKASSKKPTAGQKKPLEVLGYSPPPSSKKPKVSEAFLDQSIEQLNDVTAVSGVDLLEEDAQLFSIPKEDSRVSEASRKVVQGEEERLILEKVPLQIKLAEIVAKSGLKGISNDVERCLSLCVEERFRGLIGNLIIVSKHRLDNEKPRHKTIVTSDVGQQIMLLNRKARAEWETKHAEAEKLRKLNEHREENIEADDEKDKDKGRSRMSKANKEVEDMMRTTAANVAARAAVGGDDMSSKWKLMAEQARQNRQRDAASTSLLERELPSSISLTKYNQQVDKKVQSTANTSNPGVAKKVGKSGAVVPHPRAVGCITVKDVIAVLEREPQMSRSTLIYRLYEKIHTEAAEG